MSKKGGIKQRAFLAAYREVANISAAARAAKCHRDRHYSWLQEDPEYAAKFERVRFQAAAVLEDEAVRRAHEGVVEPVFYKGKPTGAIRVYSDTLLMFLLRGFMPEKYGERSKVEVSGLDGGPVLIADKRFDGFSNEELDKFIELAQKLEAANSPELAPGSQNP